MPEGAPPAARRPEPQLPVPPGWPFGEEFPRTCGSGRVAGGALFWTDFLYDDHGATGLPVGDLKIQAPPRGTYVYPDGPAAGNGADIFRVAIGLTETHTWWRIDWNTLVDAVGPDRAVHLRHRPRAGTASEQWPAGAGVRSPGIDLALLVSGRGAALIDLTTHVSDAGRAQRRHGVAVVRGAGPAVVGGARRAPGRCAWSRVWPTPRGTGSPTCPPCTARCPGNPTSTTSRFAATSRSRRT